MLNPSNSGSNFSLDDTLLCKGIAIFIMLFHHLFFREDSWDNFWWKLNYHGTPLIAFIATHGKICVTIFVLLSGFGMALSYKKKCYVSSSARETAKISLRFSLDKLKKLYLLYWPVFILGLLVCTIVGIHTPQTVYTSVWQCIRDFFALAYIFDGVTPFNGTWWYISFALLLYLFHPLIHKATEKFPRVCLAVSFAIGIFPTSSIAIFIEIRRYLFVYILGIVLAEKGCLNRIFDFERKKVLLFSALGCITFALVRVVWPYTFDAFIALAIIVFCTELSRTVKRLKRLCKGIRCFGKHSGNIFLIHGLLYKYLLNDFIYGFYIPILIWAVLLILSLGCSVVIESGKRISKIVICKVNGKPSAHPIF